MRGTSSCFNSKRRATLRDMSLRCSSSTRMQRSKCIYFQSALRLGWIQLKLEQKEPFGQDSSDLGAPEARHFYRSTRALFLKSIELRTTSISALPGPIKYALRLNSSTGWRRRVPPVPSDSICQPPQRYLGPG